MRSCIVSFIVFCDLIICLGWQPRWFILDDGILSYYNSQDEVGKGCKGSIKMAVCDVIGKKGPLRYKIIELKLKPLNYAAAMFWIIW